MKKYPKIIFEVMSYEDYIGHLSWMIMSNDGPLPLSKKTYELYPFLVGKIKENMDYEKIKEILKKEMISHYESEYQNIVHSINQYQTFWNPYNDRYMKNMEERLDIQWPNELNEITAFVGPQLPAYPRFVKERTFFISTNMNDISIMDTAAHECCHFLFFEKWKELYPNWSWEEFESPNMIWYLSEIVIDSILNIEEFQNLFHHTFMSYANFYHIHINGTLLMDDIRRIFQTNNISNAIKLSYQYVQEHEQEILE